jgi:hypothetical protein
MKDEKIKFSISLGRPAYDAAKSLAAASGKAFTFVVADAATQTLLATYRSDREAEILKAVERVFFKLQKLEKHQHLDLLILKEMVGLGIRAYFNHTPEILESQHSAALLSGKARYRHYLDTLARNVRQNKSILGELAALSTLQNQADGPSSEASASTAKESAASQSSSPPTNGKAAVNGSATPPKGNAEDSSRPTNGFPQTAARQPGANVEIPALFPDTATSDRNNPQQSTNTPSQTGE